MQACRTVPSVLLVHSASCKNHELCCDQACTQRTSIDVHFQRRISRSHSSAGQSVRLITVRSAAQARVGPLLRTAAHACARSACRLAGLRPASCLNHELGCGQACTQPTSISVQIQMQASRSHSSAGQSVRLITVRSAAQARVGPKVQSYLASSWRLLN